MRGITTNTPSNLPEKQLLLKKSFPEDLSLLFVTGGRAVMFLQNQEK